MTDRASSRDGTTQFLFELIDGATVEAVDIPESKRRTLCLSSQAGCALACRFCVTGYWGAGRDLSAGEILEQILLITGRMESASSVNLVFMGMGEPLLNLEAVRQSIALAGEWISQRRITVSTVGILAGLEEMMKWPRRPNLAISLHAPDADRRAAIMPVERTNPLSDLLKLLERFPLEGGRRITFEYLLIDGFNDSIRDADELVRRLSKLRAKVNLIPVNPDSLLGEAMRPPSAATVIAFRDRIQSRGLVATVRRRRGDPVSAACGQLRAFGRESKGFRRSQLSL